VDAYATFANGGTVHQPNVVWRVLEAGTLDAGAPVVLRTIEPRTQAQVDLPADVRQPILQGLVGATTQARGTASVAFTGSAATIAGKTGTAQRGEKQANEETSLFVGFGPSDAPAYAVAVVMEESGFGSSAAAPVARVMFDALSGATPLPRVVPSSERGALEVDLHSSSTVAD
jgi:penicillin-binding protein 2